MSTIRSVSSASSAAAAASFQPAPGKLRSLINNVSQAIAGVFHAIKFIGISKRNQEIYASLKQPIQQTFDISGKLRELKSNGSGIKTLAPWILPQFEKDMQREANRFKFISEDGTVLFDGAKQPSVESSNQAYIALTNAFKKAFPPNAKGADVMQVFCSQIPQMSLSKSINFAGGMYQKGLWCSLDQTSITLKQESKDRYQITWVYNVNAKATDDSDAKDVRFGTLEHCSTLDKSSGKWTVSQETRNPTPARSWTTILAIITGIAATAFAVFNKVRS